MLRSVEEQIQKAMAEGEFDDLPGRGKPIDLEAYFSAPEELRMAYSMLKGGQFVPEEVRLLKDIEALKEEYKSCADEGRRERLRKSISDKSALASMLLERLRKTK